MEKEINITEILKKKGITPTSRYHNYDYLYKSIVEVVKQACDDSIELYVDMTGYENEDIKNESIIKVKKQIICGKF